MKILFLNTNIGYGGASKMMVWVANKLAESNFDITFITYRSDERFQTLSTKIKYKHLSLEPIDGKGKNIFHTIKTLHNLIKREKFDLAVGFLTPSQLRLSLACIGLRTKLLFSHRGDPYQKAKCLSAKISDLAFKSADYYVFQTEKAKLYFSNKIRNKAAIIANPINKIERTCLRESHVEKRIVCVGRLDINQKRQDLLIAAFNLISEKFPEYILEFFGDGPDTENLKIMASKNTKIFFRGKTTDVAKSIQNAALFVLSSDYEGIPNALLEAMALGMPCISTDCSPGGAAMLIKNNINGMLVERNNVNALADSISYMLMHRDKAEDMGKEAMLVSTTFSEDIIASKWIELFNKIGES